MIKQMKEIWNQIKIFPMNIVGFFVSVIVNGAYIQFFSKKDDLPPYALMPLSENSWLLRVMKRIIELEVAAITIGSFIFININYCSNKAVLRHECKHIIDQQKWSVLYPVLYVFYSIRAAINKKNFYFDNDFEIAARKFASE